MDGKLDYSLELFTSFIYSQTHFNDIQFFKKTESINQSIDRSINQSINQLIINGRLRRCFYRNSFTSS